jgi:hypothetical protein
VAREQEGRLEETGLDPPDILGRGEFQAGQQAPVKQVANEHTYDQAENASYQQAQQTAYNFAEKHGTPQVAKRGNDSPSTAGSSDAAAGDSGKAHIMPPKEPV